LVCNIIYVMSSWLRTSRTPQSVHNQPAYNFLTYNRCYALINREDEARIAHAIKRALELQHYAADIVDDADSGLAAAVDPDYDLVILDLLMPGMDGRDVLRQLLRDRPGQAVLVLSCLAEVRFKVDCFNLGARDYLTKPFSLAELVARVRNQLRGDPSGQVIRAGNLRLHLGRMEADIGRGPLALTRLEFLVLKQLMEHAGRSVSKGQLLASAWGYEYEPASNIVGVCVRRLRSKLGDELIKTVRGEGYQLTAG